MNSFTIISAVYLLISCFSANAQQLTDTVTITRIVDGDTFHGISSKRGVKVKYRPIGMNTPEMARYGREAQPYAQEATDYMNTLIKKGDLVRVEYDVQTKDQFGRDLVYAYTMSGIFINADLVTAGWAEVATYPPNVKYVCLLYTSPSPRD